MNVLIGFFILIAISLPVAWAVNRSVERKKAEKTRKLLEPYKIKQDADSQSRANSPGEISSEMAKRQKEAIGRGESALSRTSVNLFQNISLNAIMDQEFLLSQQLMVSTCCPYCNYLIGEEGNQFLIQTISFDVDEPVKSVDEDTTKKLREAFSIYCENCGKIVAITDIRQSDRFRL
jgi:hypothetical protein